MKQPDWESLPIIIMAILGILAAVLIYNILHDTVTDEALPELKSEPIQITEPEVIFEETVTIEEKAKKPTLSDDDIMAIVAMREAEGEELIGKVAVVATILNRCDYYGLTVESVVFAPNQYSFSFDTVPNEDCYMAVKIAKRERDLFPRTMMWFLPNDWPKYGDHYLPIQNHYFNYLKEE